MDAASVRTNRDLYRFVTALVKKHEGTELALSEFLPRLATRLGSFSGRPDVSVAAFCGALAEALTGPVNVLQVVGEPHPDFVP